MSRKFSLKKLFITSAAAILAVGVSVSMMPQDAYAQATEGRQFGAKAGEIVNEALQFMNGNQHSAALGKLNQAITLPDLNRL